MFEKLAKCEMPKSRGVCAVAVAALALDAKSDNPVPQSADCTISVGCFYTEATNSPPGKVQKP